MSGRNSKTGGSKEATAQPGSRAREQKPDQELESGMTGMAIRETSPQVAPMDYWKKEKLPSFPSKGEPDPMKSKKEEDSIVTGNKPLWHPHPVQRQPVRLMYGTVKEPPSDLEIHHFSDSPWPGITWHVGSFNSKKGNPVQIVVKMINSWEMDQSYPTFLRNEKMVLKNIKHKYILDIIDEFGIKEENVPIAMIVFPKCNADLEVRIEESGVMNEDTVKIMMGQVAQALD